MAASIVVARTSILRVLGMNRALVTATLTSKQYSTVIEDEDFKMECLGGDRKGEYRRKKACCQLVGDNISICQTGIKLHSKFNGPASICHDLTLTYLTL